MVISTQKKTLVIGKEPTRCKIEIDGTSIEQILENNYLGIQLRRYRNRSEKKNKESQQRYNMGKQTQQNENQDKDSQSFYRTNNDIQNEYTKKNHPESGPWKRRLGRGRIAQ